MSLLEKMKAQAPPPEQAAKNGQSGPKFHRSDGTKWTGKGDLTSCDTLRLLKDEGLYGREMEHGKHAIKCPWAGQHSDDRPAEDSDTAYYEPSPGYEWGGFKCQHAHCSHRTMRDVFGHFGTEKVDRYCSREWKPEKAEQQAGTRGAANQATMLVNLALERGADLFHTPDGICFATIPVRSHRETHPLHAKGCREWLGLHYYQEAGKAPGSQAMQDALTVLGGMARFDRPELPVYTRLAEHEGRIYLFLADADCRAIEVSADGWTLTTSPPVRFRKTEGTLPLPLPVRGGTLADLRPFVNVNPDEPGKGTHPDFVLLASWLVAALRPRGPYTVLELRGEQGSAKSTTARVLRRTIDPNVADLRMEPKEPADLAIAAKNGWVVAFDNLSGIQPWLSDCLCRLATGGGLGKRRLWTDDEEALFDAMRPVVLTGIHGVAYRSDLLDRAILETLPQIKKRRTEKQFWADFDAAHPRILGALLDGVSVALRNLPNVNRDDLPRMADFAEWAMAAAPAFGWTAEAFEKAYTGNRGEADGVALEASPIAVHVRALADAQPKGESWEGTCKKLLEALASLAGGVETSRKSWPDSPEKLSSNLRRIAPNLRNQGVEVEFLPRTKDGRGVRIGLLPVTVCGDGSAGDGSPNAKPSPDSDVGQAQDAGSGDGYAGCDGPIPYKSQKRIERGGEDRRSRGETVIPSPPTPAPGGTLHDTLRTFGELHNWPRVQQPGGLAVGPGREAWEAQLAIATEAQVKALLREVSA